MNTGRSVVRRSAAMQRCGMTAYVYILASARHGTLYVSVTTDLAQRIWQHKNKVVPGFTRTHGVDRLVWFEPHDALADAQHRERQIKRWKRDWKIGLIEQTNPDWHDLYDGLNR
jgi:putative endonuclease